MGEGPGPPPVSGQDAHQHTFPPLPHELPFSPSVVHLASASDPSMQIEAASGSHLLHLYFPTDTTGADVGGGVGKGVGDGVGGNVGGTGA